MAFVNQVSSSNFTDQKIKTLKVLCQECIQEMGTSTRGIVVAANTTLDKVDDVKVVATGEPVITDITVTDTKVINSGYVPVTVTATVEGLATPYQLNTIATFQGHVDCPGLEPAEVVNVQKHDLQVIYVNAVPVQVILGILSVEITVVVKGCVIISKEAILKVNASSQFCVCD